MPTKIFRLSLKIHWASPSPKQGCPQHVHGLQPVKP